MVKVDDGENAQLEQKLTSGESRFNNIENGEQHFFLTVARISEQKDYNLRIASTGRKPSAFKAG